MTEGPCRMRKKLVPNSLFYVQYPYRPELELAENKSQRYKVATSFDAKDHFKLYADWRTSLIDDAKAVERVPGLQVIAHVQHDRQKIEETIDSLKDLPIVRPKQEDVQADDEEGELVPGTSLLADEGPAGSGQPPQDWQSLVRLLEENEKIGHLFKCARVQGLETVDGLILFGNS